MSQQEKRGEENRYVFSSNPRTIIQAMQLLGSEKVWDRGRGLECIVTCSQKDATALYEITGQYLYKMGGG